FGEVAVAAASEGPPAHLDHLEAAGHHRLQMLAELAGLVEQDRAVGLDAAAIVAPHQPRDRLVADLPHEVPQRDVDAADGMLDRASASLPERRLAELFGDALRLYRRFVLQQRPEQLNRPGDEHPRGKAAADADRAVASVD